MIVVAIIALILVIFIAYKALAPAPSNELSEEKENDLEVKRQKFDALGDRIKSMTVAEIVAATGQTRRRVIATLVRRGVSCSDYDGEQKKKQMETPGASEAAMKSIIEDSGKSRRYGLINPVLICPHCQVKGKVRSSIGPNEAVLTTSNTYKAKASTKMHCDSCGTDWTV